MRRTFVAALCAALVLTSAPALADDRRGGHRGDARWHHQDNDRRDRGDDRRYERHHDKHAGKHHKHRKHAKKHHRGPRHGAVVWKGKRHWGGPPRHVVHRPAPRHRHGQYHRQDRDDWAVYAILALQLVEVLNSQQQQSYAWATQRAAAAPLGDSIQWHDSGAYGSVTPVRDGTDGGGRYCREFQHQIVVGNRQQSGYGVACRQPDGAWEIVS